MEYTCGVHFKGVLVRSQNQGIYLDEFFVVFPYFIGCEVRAVLKIAKDFRS